MFHLSCFHRQALSSMQLLFKCIQLVFWKRKELIDSSSYCWSFHFWTFHIWYKVMSKTCYIFPPLFLFLCFSQVATNSTFTSETSLVLLVLKCLPSDATKKSLVKTVEHKVEEAFSNSVRGHVQLGHFILFRCPNFSTISQTYLSLTLWFYQMTVETWLHLSLTTVRCFWTIIHSWKLGNIPLQVASYKAPFTQFSPELSAH